MTLEQLKAALKVKIDGLAALKTKLLADDATNDDIAALDKANDEIESDEAKIAALERSEKSENRTAQPVDTPVEGSTSIPAVVAEKASTMEKIGYGIHGMMKAFHEDGVKGWRGIANKMDELGYGAIAEEFDAKNKALNTVTGTAGGFAIAEDFNEDIFEALMPYTGFMRGRPDAFPMPNGNYRQSGVATRPTAGYRAEGTAIAASEPTLREINMSAKLLSGMVPMTNQIIRYTGQRAASMAQRTLLQTMGIAFDSAGFEGTGAGNNPLGIYNIPAINSIAVPAGVAPSQAVVDAQCRLLLNPIASFALLQMNVAWVMPQRVKGYLEDMKDGNGNYVYPTLASDTPTFKGYPVIVVGTVNTAAGAGTNETKIGLINFGNILLGESGGLQLAISDEASFVDGGVTTSAFQNDLTLIRSTMEHDWTSRYVESVNLLVDVQWGA